jgi:hypothetical protein
MEQYKQGHTSAPAATAPQKGGCISCVTHPAVLKGINVLNGAGLITVGILYFLRISPLSAIQQSLCGFYSIICGLIFLIFSIGFGQLDTCNRRNCGFVYTFYGRFLFVVFAGSLCFGLPDPAEDAAAAKAAKATLAGSALGMAVGFISWANAFFNLFIICMMPEYSNAIGGDAGPNVQQGAPNAGPGSFQPPSEQSVISNSKPDPFGANQSWNAPDSSAYGAGNSGDDNPFA